jgi:hypothetical protein
MTNKLILTPVERDFFKTVAQAAFTTPFSQTRIDLDHTIAGTSAAMSWDDLVIKATARISENLAKLKQNGTDKRPARKSRRTFIVQVFSCERHSQIAGAGIIDAGFRGHAGKIAANVQGSA